VHTIDGFYLDSDGVNNGDDFGWFADGSFSLVPETLTFAGSLIFEADITEFGEGATVIVNPGDSFSVNSTSEITPLNMTFTAVPEPSAYASILGLVAIWVACRRKH